MIGWLIGEFWPFIVAGIGLLAGLLGFRQAGKERTKRQVAERRANTHKEMRDNEREASQLDDVSLADRISRKP